MSNDQQIKRISRGLVYLNFIGPFLFALAAAALLAINYEWLIIIEFLVGVVVFTLVFAIGVILWKHTVGFFLAFGVGIWWGYKTRNDDRD